MPASIIRATASLRGKRRARQAVLGILGAAHQCWIVRRRARVLAHELATVIPTDATTVLDVGCGDGMIDALLKKLRPSLAITGVDVALRDAFHVPVTLFDGHSLPFPDRSVDVVMFVDALHHAEDPFVLLREAGRVARLAIVLKDHTQDSAFAYPTLRFMDLVGNARHGVALPYNYWPERKWRAAWAELGLSLERWQPQLGLYPFPASLVFERRLHFVARLTPHPTSSRLNCPTSWS